MATYAIGDVQGCCDALRRLLDLAGFDPACDTLWLTGDLVNRGPQSAATLRFVKSLGDAALTVLGNHDLYLLLLGAGCVKKRARDDTLDDVLDAPDRDELLDWLRHRPLCHLEEQDGQMVCLVHAGLLPQWRVKKARELAAEVEAQLQGENYRDFYTDLWGSKPARWSSGLAGMDRWRTIVNALTRMRFITPDGKMEFASKGLLADAPQGYIPWFEAPRRKSAEDLVIVGHWSALGLTVSPHLIMLDTGYLWGGTLTAVRLE
ncbi:MAG: symmetrical bis(5'-nucleosyl)-tetraphosphatase, partial [Zoogloeaceae bacterium]|nr:symmetrical bis(5'-nucleosyl)-tetraphosphatase [Zoogloeaceae bacterium]